MAERIEDVAVPPVPAETAQPDSALSWQKPELVKIALSSAEFCGGSYTSDGAFSYCS